MSKQHTIELNGKRYDAITGKLVTANNHQTTPASQPNHSKKRPRSIDGFTSARSSLPKTSVKSIARHSLQKSKTLMRGGVTKPAHQSTKQPKKIIEVGQLSVPPRRKERANNIRQSNLVKHFGEMTNSVQSIKPKLAAATTRAAEAVSPAIISFPKNFSAALSKADSHKQPKLAKSRWHNRLAKRLKLKSKIINVSALLLAIVAIGGYFTYLNLPNLNMRLAAARANVHATLPAYQPTGFHLAGRIQIKPGQVVVRYNSNSDNRNFAITQTTSAWNSESLKDNYLADKTALQTIQGQGKTVFLYNNSSATWVDGGVWYRIEGNSQLNSDQLQKIAHSL